MADEVQTWKPVKNNRLRNLAILYLLIIVAVFLAGFLPMWSRARASEKALNVQQSELNDLRLLALLGNATIDARRGDYEPARRVASDFFTRITQAGVANSSAQSDQFAAIQRQRDEIITLLARSDPASAERLSNLYITLRSALGRELSAPSTAAPTTVSNAAPVPDATNGTETNITAEAANP